MFLVSHQDVDECWHVANADAAVTVHVGSVIAERLWIIVQQVVDERRHVADANPSVTVHVARLIVGGLGNG